MIIEHIDERTVRSALELATHAPSVHNSQPWMWQYDARTVRLYADFRRQLPGTDATGRDLILSCGAALHHLRAALAASGIAASIRRMPDNNAPEHLASRQPAQQPACWRLLHRVTYVSRILEPISPQADAFTQAMRALDLSSNYELVRTLAPYVAGRTASYGDFVLAVRQAVDRRLPDLVDHLDQVTAYLAEYYGFDQAS